MKELQVNIDLRKTLDGGQTFLWKYKDNKYSTAFKGKKIEITGTDKGLKYKGANEDYIKKRIGLECDFQKIQKSFPDDPILKKAIKKQNDAKVVNDPFFPCVISFILSANNRIGRTKSLVNKIKKNYGEKINCIYTFPDSEKLAKLKEEELRNLGLGYRAPYVKESSKKISEGKVEKDKLKNMEYENAREELKKLPGVGNKVADCILLFSLNFRQSVPLDTWILKIIKKYYPELKKGGYIKTSKAFRNYFGKYSGYAQNFLFHHFRNSDILNK